MAPSAPGTHEVLRCLSKEERQSSHHGPQNPPLQISAAADTASNFSLASMYYDNSKWTIPLIGEENISGQSVMFVSRH